MKPIKILIVENDDKVILPLANHLKSLGYEACSIAASGEDAIEKAEADAPDIVLLNIRLNRQIKSTVAARIDAMYGIPIVFLLEPSEISKLDSVYLSMPFTYLVTPVIRSEEIKAAIELSLRKSDINAGRIALEQELKMKPPVLDYQELVESLNSIIMMFDPEGTITFANAYARELFGFAENDLLGKKILGTILPYEESTGRNLEKMFGHILKNPKNHLLNENENIRSNGERMWVSWTNKGIFDDRGNLTALLSEGQDITKRKHFEAELKTSEEKFALAQKSAGMGSWNWDIKMNRLEWSDSIEPLFGFQKGAFRKTYEAFVECIHIEDREFVSQSVNAALAGEKDYHIKHRIVWPDGSLHWMQETGTVFRDDSGKPIQMVGIVQDITDQKLNQERLENQTDMIQSVLDSIEESAFLMDTKGNILFANRTVARRLNMPLDVIIGSNLSDLLPPDLLNARLERIKDVITSKKSHTFVDEREGYVLENSIFPILNQNQEVEALSVLSIDITQRLKNEADIRTLWRAIEQSPSSIVITDREGAIEYVNPAFCHSTGYTTEEALGENPRILRSGQHDAAFYQGMWATIASGKLWTGEICNRKKDGRLYWEQASISQVADDKGETTHYLAVKEDITLKKESELAKEQMDRIMRHDLKTPLNGILGYPQILLKMDLSDKQKKYIHQIERAGQTMLQIIDTYLSLSKMESGKYNINAISLNLLDILKSVIVDLEPQARTKQIRFCLAINQRPLTDNDIVTITGEQTMCYAVFSNLMKNAMEASPDSQDVRIDIVPRTPNVDITIKNQGVVPLEIRDRFFDKYSTYGKAKGTGLGAYSAKLMTETQGGTIVMQTSEEEGSTTITVTLSE